MKKLTSNYDGRCSILRTNEQSFSESEWLEETLKLDTIFFPQLSYPISTTPQKSEPNSIWNPTIPPSNSTLIWRIFHYKMHTNTNLALMGVITFLLCVAFTKIRLKLTSISLLSFLYRLWNWLQNTINQSIDFSSFTSTLKVSNRSWSPQCSLVICVVVIATLKTVWQSRNVLRFQNKTNSISTAITNIVGLVSLTDNATNLTTSPFIQDFTVPKAFKVRTRPPKAPRNKRVIWCPPNPHWIKCNTCSSSLGPSFCGGISRSASCDCIGYFATFLDAHNSLYAGLMKIILASEFCHYSHL
ncbi:uncharacterized protein LOC131613253 [Vicia villosa]|uniref:uncharacterized protein LOC131613253 n=1 Tax=Vicia villosa TaxID=3911 RepID=UPI00273B00E7|nr:uncharacterized protein LOC131613253 [Vicia villosa]